MQPVTQCVKDSALEEFICCIMEENWMEAVDFKTWQVFDTYCISSHKWFTIQDERIKIGIVSIISNTEFFSLLLYGSYYVVMLHPMIQLVQCLIQHITSVFYTPIWLQFFEISRNRVHKRGRNIVENAILWCQFKWWVQFGWMADWRRMALSDWCSWAPLTPVWHGHNGLSDSSCARASPPAPSSDSPCVTEHLPQHCRVSSLAPSPHSTSPCCHWVKGGKKSIAPQPMPANELGSDLQRRWVWAVREMKKSVISQAAELQVP